VRSAPSLAHPPVDEAFQRPTISASLGPILGARRLSRTARAFVRWVAMLIRIVLSRDPCPVEPFRQLVRVGVDIRPAGPRNTMDRQPARRFPTLYGPLVAPKKRADFFPGIERRFARGLESVEAISRFVPNCPLLPFARAAAPVNDTPDRGVCLEPSCEPPQQRAVRRNPM